ncbi:MAG TPA: hypothetical protein VLL74_03115 [Methanoregula sp.]|nr:hypothetical protein [Methanoregula sp.]
MADKPRCAQCGREAIGIQSFGCRSARVCREHACALLLALSPGKCYSNGECYLERFGTALPDRSPTDQSCS